MEIVDFLHLTVRRVVSLVLVGLVVAVPTTAILLRHPATYEGTVSVRLTGLLPNGGAYFVRDRLTQDFQTAIDLPQVADAVSQQTGVSADDVADRVTTALPSSNGDVVLVTFTDS